MPAWGEPVTELHVVNVGTWLGMKHACRAWVCVHVSQQRGCMGMRVPDCMYVRPWWYKPVCICVCEHEQEDKPVHRACHVLGSVHASVGIPCPKESPENGMLVA